MIVFLFSAVAGSSIAQQEEATRFSRNAIYFEFLGQGFLYSINYDHRFTPHIGVRAGLSFWSLPFLWSDINVSAFPIMFTYLTGNGNRHFEVALGVVPAIIANNGGSFFGLDLQGTKDFAVFGTATIGYRSQPRKGGFLFRIGLTPLFTFNFKRAILIVGLSLGYAFGPPD
jgi:hypothetical protein